MNGKIYFINLTDLALFLKALEGSTSTFEVVPLFSGTYRWVLTFTGGY